LISDGAPAVARHGSKDLHAHGLHRVTKDSLALLDASGVVSDALHQLQQVVFSIQIVNRSREHIMKTILIEWYALIRGGAAQNAWTDGALLRALEMVDDASEPPYCN
jgi:hypothetical protein